MGRRHSRRLHGRPGAAHRRRRRRPDDLRQRPQRAARAVRARRRAGRERERRHRHGRDHLRRQRRARGAGRGAPARAAARAADARSTASTRGRPACPGAELLAEGAAGGEAELGALEPARQGRDAQQGARRRAGRGGRDPDRDRRRSRQRRARPIVAGEPRGTRFAAAERSESAFKLWLRFGKPVRGRIGVDAGARRAIVAGRAPACSASASSACEGASRPATPSSWSARTARRSQRGSPRCPPRERRRPRRRRGGAPRPAGDSLRDGVPPGRQPAAVRVRADRRPEDAAPPRRRGRDRPRVRQPRPPVARRRGREARRGGAQPAQPPLLDEPRHPEAAPRRSATSTARKFGVELDLETELLDDRREGRLLAPDVDARRPGRHRARAEPVVPDPHLGADPRRRRRALRAHGARARTSSATCVEARRAGVAAAARDRLSFPHNPTTASSTSSS